jgi:YhcH/YjgK/YiaL family protein
LIIDSLSGAEKYLGAHRHFNKAFEWIRQQDLDKLEPGKYPIDGTDIHASVSVKDGVTREDAKFEAHDNYIDIQVCLSEEEQMGWKPRSKCVSYREAYNPEKDVTFYNDRPDLYFDLHQNQFAIFFPEDVHAPMIGTGPIKKLVIKVKQ